jgi:hypothetical protein
MTRHSCESRLHSFDYRTTAFSDLRLQLDHLTRLKFWFAVAAMLFSGSYLGK